MSMNKTPGTTGLVMEEPLLVERSHSGRKSCCLPKLDIEAPDLSEFGDLVRDETEGLPELSEVDLVRHYFRLSQWNYNVESGVYPLGSCTMKHNPKVNEKVCRFAGFTATHPYDPEALVQGNLELLYRLEEALKAVSGFEAITLQPAAGAHGELTAAMMIRAYHVAQGKPRHKVLIPDSAHGTNPATSALAGFSVVEIKTGPEGFLTAEAVADVMDEDTAAVMLTNPNTLGIYEQHIAEIAKIVHDKGGLLYMDGANFNAQMGYMRPGDIDVDAMHFNLHKTFSTPHGGGGPGSGPVGVGKRLVAHLPTPRVVKEGETYRLNYDIPESIGPMRSFYGNFGVNVRALAYMLELGHDGLKAATEMAVLNANYIRARLQDHYKLPYATDTLHECVFSDALQKEHGISNVDISKRLIDFGFHPPTMSFPLIVHGALMIEPTETESKEELDAFCDAFVTMAKEAKENPEIMHSAPHNSFRRRLDETTAARKPVLTWKMLQEDK